MKLDEIMLYSYQISCLMHVLTFWLSNIVVDKCLSNPCQNGGTCKNIEDGFQCSCTSDYRGTLCEGKK